MPCKCSCSFFHFSCFSFPSTSSPSLFLEKMRIALYHLVKLVNQGSYSLDALATFLARIAVICFFGYLRDDFNFNKQLDTLHGYL